jgi:hypothetical protein
MSSSLGEAVLELVGDASQLMKDIKTAKGDVLASMDKMGQDMQKVGMQMTGAVTLPIIGLGLFATDAASNYEETKNKSSEVFEAMSQDALEWSKTAATALGQSQQAALDAIATFGAMGKSAGLNTDENLKWAESMVTLSSDWASFYNLRPEDALAAIQSATAGQYEPLRRMGIVIDKAAVKTKALQMGLIGEKEELTQAASYQALYALMVEKSTAAQGDFLRTADGLANSTRIAKAQLADAAVTLGTQLLPYALQAVQFISGLITQFSGLSPEIQKTIVVVLAIAAAIGPLLLVVGSLITTLTAIWPVLTAIAGVLAGPVGLAILAIIAVLGLLYLAWTNNWGGIQEKLAAVWAWLQPILVQLWNWLATNVTAALAKLASFWTNTLLPAIMAVWNWMSQVLFPFLQAIGNFLGAVFGLQLKILAGIWQNVLWPALKLVFGVLATQLMPVFEALARWWNTTGAPIARAIADWFGGYIVDSFRRLTGILQTVTGWLRDVTNTLNNMKLPAWMTPGSPTPWEIGLWGVQEALQAVSGMGLPELSGNLGAMAAPALSTGNVMSGLGGGMGGNVQFVFSPMISTGDQYEAERVLAPFIEKSIRQARKQ